MAMSGRRLAFGVLLFSILGADVVASISPYGNTNKGLFVLPRSAGMAGADLCFARDGSPLSNPAVLPLDSSSEIMLSYAGFYRNTLSTSMLSYVTRVGDRTGMGISVAYLFVPDIENTTGFEYDSESRMWIYDQSRLTYSSSSEVMVEFMLGHAFLLGDVAVLSVGGGLHCLRRRLIDWTGYGIGLDGGVVAEAPKLGLRVAFLVDDISTNYVYWGSDYSDVGPPHIRAGLGWRLELPYIYGRVVLSYRSVDLFARDGAGLDEDNEARPPIGNFGMEYLVYRTVALRFGYSETGGFIFGGGLELIKQALLFDFSYMLPSDLPGTYHVGMGYRW